VDPLLTIVQDVFTLVFVFHALGDTIYQIISNLVSAVLLDAGSVNHKMVVLNVIREIISKMVLAILAISHVFVILRMSVRDVPKAIIKNNICAIHAQMDAQNA
jgi:hypothetical protein